MKTDRELLELAAKAAGLEITEKMADFYARKRKEDRFELWNPLTDDGDALRLAVKLNMDMLITDEWTKIKQRKGHWIMYDGRELSAIEITRRAIVRAAAEIGRAMP